MSNVSVTRMELLARKAQIALASQGRDLLEQKRTALMKEFMRTADTAMEHSDALQVSATNASQSLARAEAMAGAESVRAAALASRGGFELEVTTASVMGVRVPQIEQKSASRSFLERGYSIVGTSISIDETASAFEREVEAIIQLAETELRLVRLGDEIQRTSRRLNALDHFLIPRLKAERDFIQMALDERERADHFRLKLVKRSLERKRETDKPA
ncbi:MAG TPA: V-type ATP synthase subunit D [Anaerolineales bacterium]|nr:V-type ATP synthase subunit D [Anaerolineales bacterium]